MSELGFLLQVAKSIEDFDEPSARHLTSPLSLRNYARLANETTKVIRGSRVLDWGCGYGLMSYLLARRGLAVTSYDVGSAMEDRRVPVTRQLRAVRGGHPYRLPFRSCAFEAVLACGVLEHVADVEMSLDEIHRVLVPGGQFFVYNLPQRYSYKELVIEHLNLGYSHERRYTSSAIRVLLERHGFRVVSVRRAGLLPYLATGLSPSARRHYYSSSSRLFHLDRVLSRTPLLNLTAQSLEVVAETAATPRSGSRGGRR